MVCLLHLCYNYLFRLPYLCCILHQVYVFMGASMFTLFRPVAWMIVMLCMLLVVIFVAGNGQQTRASCQLSPVSRVCMYI